MSILGVGVDLVFVPDFATQLDEPGTRFGQVFTPGERADAHSRGTDLARHLAVRWAAKEAVIKAWSDALHGRPPVLSESVHRDIEVVCDAWGRPRIRLFGDVGAHLSADQLRVSLSHDGDYAIAYVLLGDEGVTFGGEQVGGE